jgi:hypothetical protein
MNGDAKSAVGHIHENGVNGTSSTSKGTNGDDAAYVPEVVKPAPQVQAQPTPAESSFEVSLSSLRIVLIDMCEPVGAYATLRLRCLVR